MTDDLHVDEPLPAEDVERLPEGARVRVIWSGGNGPHEYVIAIDRHGRRYAAMNDDPDDRLRWYNPLAFVGVDRFNTRVWRVGDMGGGRCDFCPRPGRLAHCRCPIGHQVGVWVCDAKHERDLGTVEIACRVCYEATPQAVRPLTEVDGGART